jgi:hypothetical protein
LGQGWTSLAEEGFSEIDRDPRERNPKSRCGQGHVIPIIASYSTGRQRAAGIFSTARIPLFPRDFGHSSRRSLVLFRKPFVHNPCSPSGGGGPSGALRGSGTIQTVTFKAVVPAGPDIYEVKFDKGAQEWTIWLSPEGRVDSANFRPGSKVVTPPP